MKGPVLGGRTLVGSAEEVDVSDELMFVQLLHPGSEHEPEGSLMEWNRGAHKRKFLKSNGAYVADGVVQSGSVAFWGEWEPQSRVVETFPKNGPEMPRRLQEPFWRAPKQPGSWQNTDPLVFGDHFLYSNCRQPTNRKLRALAAGSIILFGSNLHGEFVLDTVFVVGSHSERFTAESSNSIQSDGWVQEVVFERLRQSACAPPGPTARAQTTCTPTGPLRLYQGVTYAESRGGPFSFVPCNPLGAEGPAFARPAVRLERTWIAPNLRMSAKATRATVDQLAAIWETVLHQVMDAGLALGVSLEVPPRDTGDASSA